MINISNLPIKTAIFHGPSGSGKDTQLDLLEKEVEYIRIGSSAVMEDLLRSGDEVAKEANEYGKKGILYPDELMYDMFHRWLQSADGSKRWFFVSPVRKVTQIPLFDALMKEYDRELDLFVHFDLSREAAIERMSLRSFCPVCQTTYHDKYKPEKVKGVCDQDGEKLIRREDDKPEAIGRRLDWYKEDLKPILEEYEKRSILIEVDASPPIEEVYEDLTKKLSDYGKEV